MGLVKKIIIRFIVFILFSVMIGFLFATLMKNLPAALDSGDYSVMLDKNVLLEKTTYIQGFLISAVLHLLYMFNTPKGVGTNLLSSKAKRIEAGMENSDWLSKNELNSIFDKVSFSKLDSYGKDGIPINAIYNKKLNDLSIHFAKPTHGLVLGATGSGKTTGFINPMIQIIGSSSAGSSMICTDPKGELFQLHSKFLKSRNYEVMLLDLRDCYNSYRWNPLTPIYRLYQEYIKKANEIYERNDDLHSSGIKLRYPAERYSPDVWYEFDGQAYPDKSTLLDAVTVTRQKLYDEAYEDLNDIMSIVCPIESEKDPIWDRGARSIVFAIALAMLEDSENPELGMTEERFNLYNINMALGNSADNYKELRDYFSGRSSMSKAVNMAKQVLTTAPETLASYMTNAYDKLSLFNDSGIAALTSGMDVNLSDFGNKPCALFIKVPDEKDTRHRLAAMFMVSLYKSLVKEASKHDDLSLPRNVYYLLDEFGNMPKINKFETMITVGRSRKIWFIIVIQSYAQLDSVYGEKISEIIKGNCPMKMFIGSNDMKTCEEFSKLCGNMSVASISSSRQLETRTGDTNVSQQTQQRPLIYPSELQMLNNSKATGNAIVATLGNKPLKAKFTPSYMCPLYSFGIMNISDVVENAFYEDEVYYDLHERNVIILKNDEEENQDFTYKLNVENTENNEKNVDDEQKLQKDS